MTLQRRRWSLGRWPRKVRWMGESMVVVRSKGWVFALDVEKKYQRSAGLWNYLLWSILDNLGTSWWVEGDPDFWGISILDSLERQLLDTSINFEAARAVRKSASSQTHRRPLPRKKFVRKLFSRRGSQKRKIKDSQNHEFVNNSSPHIMKIEVGYYENEKIQARKDSSAATCVVLRIDTETRSRRV